MDRFDEIAERIANRWFPPSLPKSRHQLSYEIATALRDVARELEAEVEHARQSAQEGV
jgi:hypothetical protein